MNKMKLGVGVGVVAVVTAALAIAIPALAGNSAAKSVAGPSIGAVASSHLGGLDAATVADIQTLNQRGVGAAVLGRRLVADARTLPTRVDGDQLYLVPTETGKVAFGLGNSLEEWVDPLSSTHPVLFAASDDDGPGGAGPTGYGVAIDGVSSVTLTIDGSQKTVPVAGNVFVFHGASDASFTSIAPVSANFANGTEQALK